MSEFLPIVYLSVVSFFAWIMSTLAGGGSPFILIPVETFGEHSEGVHYHCVCITDMFASVYVIIRRYRIISYMYFWGAF